MSYFQIFPFFSFDKHFDVDFEHWIKTVPSRMYAWFYKICPRDLLFDQKWPSFKSDLDFMEENILTQFREVLIKTVPFRVYISFSKIWPSDLIFNRT